MAWIGVAAAILVGGGVYIVSRSNPDKSESSHGKATAHVPPKKRKRNHLLCLFHEMIMFFAFISI